MLKINFYIDSRTLVSANWIDRTRYGSPTWSLLSKRIRIVDSHI